MADPVHRPADGRQQSCGDREAWRRGSGRGRGLLCPKGNARPEARTTCPMFSLRLAAVARVARLNLLDDAPLRAERWTVLLGPRCASSLTCPVSILRSPTPDKLRHLWLRQVWRAFALSIQDRRARAT